MNQTKSWNYIIASLMLLLMMVTASFGADVASEVRRLNKEAPSLDGFNGADGLVWLKDSQFKMLADGSIEEYRLRIVMVGERIPEAWQVMRLPVPAGGSLEIEEAACYNPMLAMKERALDVHEETLDGGAKVFVVRTPDNAIGRVVVLATRTVYPGRFGADAMVPLADPLPIWEQNVSVEVPGVLDLVWGGKGVSDPVIRKHDNGTEEYRWNIMNQTPWQDNGFLEYSRPFVAFSFKSGIMQNITAMNTFAQSFPTLSLPAFAQQGDKGKAAVRLMQWVAEPARTLKGYPQNYVRSPEQIPANGPWTPWEQTLLLNKWLTRLGWETKVWWRALTELDEKSPATKGLWDDPVLQVTTGPNKKVWYQAGQTSDFGITAPSVTGSNLYTKGEDSYLKQTVSAGSASSHRLSLLWVLKLAEDGVADGTLTVNATGGWTELLSYGQVPEKENLSAFIRERINFALPGMVLTPTGITGTRTGYKLVFDVRCAPGIVHGDSMLLRLPGSIPSRVGEMIGRESSYTFRFPFIIDQKVRMKMPGGYRLLQSPPLKNLGEGSKAVLKESITHWPKRAELIADSTWVVKTREVDEYLAMLLREELAANLRWPVLDLPFRK